jgi:hypothetical protein
LLYSDSSVGDATASAESASGKVVRVENFIVASSAAVAFTNDLESFGMREDGVPVQC